jgi:hypothetical protein
VSANEAPVTAQTKPELSTFGRARLEPGVYNLDLSEVATFPLKDNGQPSTFAGIYHKLREAKVLKVPEWVMGEATFHTDAGEVTVSYESGQPYVSGQLFVVTVLRDLIDLHKDGIDPHRATWFYYGHDWSRDADEMYEFFVVHDGKIVRERFSCMHVYPRVLVKYKVDDEPIWHSEPYGHQAWETYWYRRFYTETLTGQLMVLRPDEPTLYHYDRAMHDVTRDVEFVTIIKIYSLLGIAVTLIAAIAFPILRPYMAIVAAALFVDLLWRSWATRKIGR